MNSSALGATPGACLLLSLAGAAGGFIDAIAGGGGLITVPALLAAGLPPQIALGTNKLQSSCGTLLVVWRYQSAGLMRTPAIGWAVSAALLGSILGASAVSVLDPRLLRAVIPWMLAALAIYTVLNRSFGVASRVGRVPPRAFAVGAGLLLGAYDGFFGPGTGSFWMIACVTLLGLDLRMATGYTKAANLTSNLGSLAIFLSHGSIDLGAGAAMIAGQMIGARLGSGLVLRKGIGLIRPVFLAVVFALTAKLIWDGFRG